MLALLKANPLMTGLGALLLLTAGTAAVQTARIGNLQERVGSLGAEIEECARANESNQRTIDELTATAAENAERAREALAAQERISGLLDELEQKRREEADEAIEDIRSTDDDCATAPLPDGIRLRLDPRSN